MGRPVEQAEQFPQVGKGTRGTNTRMPIGLRDWPLAKVTLRKYNITESDIVNDTGLPKSTVSRSLNYKHFYKCSYLTIQLVRTTVELMLDEAGWPQASDEAQGVGMLWSDYEQRIEGML